MTPWGEDLLKGGWLPPGSSVLVHFPDLSWRFFDLEVITREAQMYLWMEGFDMLVLSEIRLSMISDSDMKADYLY